MTSDPTAPRDPEEARPRLRALLLELADAFLEEPRPHERDFYTDVMLGLMYSRAAGIDEGPVRMVLDDLKRDLRFGPVVSLTDYARRLRHAADSLS